MPKCAKEELRLHAWLLCVFVVLAAPRARAQLTFASAVERATENSPRVKSAQQDVKRATAALAVTKDIFIPSVITGAGLGTAYGITLTVPTIFTINAQSLVYSAQQRFYIRAARSDLLSSQLALADARSQAEEDTATTYLSLDRAQKALAAVKQQYGFVLKLVSIVQDRVNGKLDSELELLKARRTAVQLKLAIMRGQDDVDALKDQLAQLTGLSADSIVILPESIPAFPAPPSDAPLSSFPQSPGILSAQANATARLQRARGDSIYTWRPQVTFGAQYGRISPIENVSTFYNLHNNYNTASIGVQIQFPMLDQVRKAAAREAAADALRNENDLQGLRFDTEQGRKKLLRSLPELAGQAELADLEQQIAQNELNSTLVQLKSAAAAGPILTPKEEINARIQERQKYLDWLDAKLQLEKAQVSYLRQTGSLEKWLQSPVPRNR